MTNTVYEVRSFSFDCLSLVVFWCAGCAVVTAKNARRRFLDAASTAVD